MKLSLLVAIVICAIALVDGINWRGFVYGQSKQPIRGGRTGRYSRGFSLFKNTNPTGCERVVQSAKYNCQRSSSDCRACCHFDLSRMNSAYNYEKQFYIKDSRLVPSSNECLCEFCKNVGMTGFDNMANFK